jgi:putative oxidoreductase
MGGPLHRFEGPVYAIFRIVVGALFLQHGLQKLFGLLDGNMPPTGSQMWFGGVIELVCGTLVLVGLQAGWAAFLASGTMAVAYFQVHQTNGKGALPIQNGGELAVVYCFVFLLIAAKGDGMWSISGLRKRS